MPGEQIVQTDADFWMYAAAPTGVIVLSAVYIVLWNKFHRNGNRGGNASTRVLLRRLGGRRRPDLEGGLIP